MKEIKLKSCPNCGRSGKTLWINGVIDGAFLGRFFDKYFVECPTCHWCGKTKYFLRRAIKAWNRRAGNE